MNRSTAWILISSKHEFAHACVQYEKDVPKGMLPSGMSGSAPTAPASDLARAIEIGPAEIDNMSELRHLHALSARRLAAGMFSEAEIASFASYIYSEAYSARIADIVRVRRLLAARLDGALIGTAGWTPANDAGAVARLMGVFISPLYARLGVGRRLVAAVEAEAHQAGFAVFTIRAPLGAAEFFTRLGYDVASHGVWPLDRDAALPVAFMRKIARVASVQQP